LEKKSGENGYIPSMVVLGFPRNLVKTNVKNVNKNREENMEYKARILDLSKPSSLTNSFSAVQTFLRILKSFNFMDKLEIITYQQRCAMNRRRIGYVLYLFADI
jgi:hypothetical protein